MITLSRKHLLFYLLAFFSLVAIIQFYFFSSVKKRMSFSTNPKKLVLASTNTPNASLLFERSNFSPVQYKFPPKPISLAPNSIYQIQLDSEQRVEGASLRLFIRNTRNSEILAKYILTHRKPRQFFKRVFLTSGEVAEVIFEMNGGDAFFFSSLKLYQLSARPDLLSSPSTIVGVGRKPIVASLATYPLR